MHIITTPLDPGPLEDADLRLMLTHYAPHPIHQVPSCFFSMMDNSANAEAGNINLRLGWDENLTQYAGHIGYGVHEPFRGRHVAARAVNLLKPLARRHGFAHLWITCNPDNLASRRTCEYAGAHFIEIVDLPPGSVYYARGIRRKCRYRLDLVG
jgi:predicted acetyltransferase